MALPFFNWSRTAASNATADSTVNWAEGQAPSSVNDSARAMMASTAAYRDDVSGSVTTGGTATAYTVTSYQVFSSLALMSGQMIAFVPHATNTNAVGVDVTLNVDGLGAKSIRMQPSVALPNGTLVLGTPYVVTYNNSDAVFYLRGMTNPYSVPLGGGLDFWGTTAPNSSFAFPAGQAISQTTYAALYALFGANAYGTDGGGLFSLPDKTGRVSAMKEASATRLTAAVSGVTGSTMGSASGTQSKSIAQANLPSGITLTTTVTDPGHSHGLPQSNAGSSFSGSTALLTNPNGGLIAAANATTSQNVTTGITASTALGGSGTALAVVQPTIICQYIIRII